MICASLVLLQIMFAVHRFAQGAEGKVLKMDRPLAAGGFLSLTGPLAPRVVVAADAADFEEKGRGSAAGCVEGLHRFAQGATAPAALRVADCLSGNAYKVSVTDSPFCVIWHDRHSADWLAALASPYPASPDFPLFRGQNRFLCFPAETWLHG